jgi:hypothetical protein
MEETMSQSMSQIHEKIRKFGDWRKKYATGHVAFHAINHWQTQ